MRVVTPPAAFRDPAGVPPGWAYSPEWARWSYVHAESGFRLDVKHTPGFAGGFTWEAVDPETFRVAAWGVAGSREEAMENATPRKVGR